MLVVMEDRNFMILDDSDLKILLMLLKRSSEFTKLDSADQKILVWFLVNAPAKLRSWIDYLSNSYNKKGTNAFDAVKLYDEIKDLL